MFFPVSSLTEAYVFLTQKSHFSSSFVKKKDNSNNNNNDTNNNNNSDNA